MKKVLLLITLLISSLCAFSQETKEYTIYFDLNEYKITKGAQAALDSISAFNTEKGQLLVEVKGYADSTGVADFNKALANRRAAEVKEYLVSKGFSSKNIKAVTGNLKNRSRDISKDRKVTLLITRPVNIVPAGYKERQFKASGGTIVNAVVPEGSADDVITIDEYFGTKDMISNDMYAIDENGEVLRTWGMISICNNLKPENIKDGYYVIKFPYKDQEDDDPGMSVWTGGNSNNGVRWRNTDITISRDTINKYYIFQVPVSLGCININLDKPCGQGVDPLTNQPLAGGVYYIVYVATYKPFDFTDVAVKKDKSSLRFSAKLNDTLWAFAVPAKKYVRNMVFTGTYFEGDAKKELFAPLARGKYKKDKKKNHHFYLCEECLNPVAVKKEKGFFAWVRRLFKGEA